MKTGISLLLIIGMMFVSPPKVKAEDNPEAFAITLEESQKAAEKNSNALQAAEYLLKAAKAQATSAASSLYPRADLNGNYFYQTHVPTQTLGASSIKMGAKDNYSFGPVISYTLFDGGRIINNLKSARLNVKARAQDLLAQKRTLAYSVNRTYARVQICATDLELAGDALKLAQDQDGDIELRFKAGTASRLDRISAHKEMLNYKLFFQQAQNNLSSALQDLFALIGSSGTYNTLSPLPAEILGKLPRDISPPTLLVSVDSLQNTLSVLSPQISTLIPPGEDTPQIRSLSLSAQAYEKSAKSQGGARWPRFNLSAESRTAYPDLSNKEQYNNNIFAVSVSFPLWDWKQAGSLADKYQNEARAQEKEKAQKLSDLTRDNVKASDTIGNLQVQRQISEQAADEAQEIARLTYQSYTAGKSTYLEVQSANLKLMQARINTAEIEYALINNITEMKYISGNQNR